MIDVALRPTELRGSDIAVVIDVLRATSTVTEALAAGYTRVVCVDSVERARSLRAPHRLLAGERRCVMPKGFDLGNSPLDVRRRGAEELVLATTNGTPAIVAAAEHAPTVILASVLNLGAVIDELRHRVGPRRVSVQLVCAGSDGQVALEDVYLAGRLSIALRGPRTDRSRIAEAVARAYRKPRAGLAAGSHAGRLNRAGLSEDVAYCSLESSLDAVPVVATAGAGFAVAVARTVSGVERASRQSPRLAAQP